MKGSGSEGVSTGGLEIPCFHHPSSCLEAVQNLWSVSRHCLRGRRYTVDAMALFSRRFLQRTLDESPPYLSVKCRQNFCKLLNTVRDDYLATEWEMAILHVLNELGALKHEPDFPGQATLMFSSRLMTGSRSLQISPRCLTRGFTGRIHSTHSRRSSSSVRGSWGCCMGG